MNINTLLLFFSAILIGANCNSSGHSHGSGLQSLKVISAQCPLKKGPSDENQKIAQFDIDLIQSSIELALPLSRQNLSMTPYTQGESFTRLSVRFDRGPPIWS